MSIKIQDLSSNHKYRTEIPNIIFEIGLSPNHIGLYAAFKKCAGDKGNCTKSKKTLCEQLKISKNTLKLLTRELCEKNPILNKPLIISQKRTSEYGDNDTDLISINDIWPENFAYFNEKYRGGSKFDPPGSNSDLGGSKFTGRVGQNLTEGGSKFDPKEEPIEEEPNEEYISRKARTAAELPKSKSNFLIQEEYTCDGKVVNLDFIQQGLDTIENAKLNITNTIRPTNSIEKETKSNKTKLNETKTEQKISFGVDANVKLTRKEYDNLLQNMNEKEREDWIETIRLEIGKKGEKYFNNKYKSHYCTILSWKRLEEKRNPKPQITQSEKKVVIQDPKIQKLIQENKIHAKEMAHKFEKPNVIYSPKDNQLEIKIKREGRSDKFYQIPYQVYDFKKQIIDVLREHVSI